MNSELVARLRLGLPVAVVALLSGLGIIAVFFGGVLPTGLTESIPVSAGIVQLLVGAVLVGVGIVYLRTPTTEADSSTGTTSSLVQTEMPPERPKRPPRIVGQQFDATVDDALREVRLKDVAYRTTDPHQILSQTVQDILSARGYDSTKIDYQLATGEWTADPVAKGFLGDSVDYPVWFNLLRWAKPGVAYQRAIDRTTLAVQSLFDGHVGEPPSTTGWFSEFRADVERYLNGASVGDGSEPQSSDPQEAK